MTPYLLLAFGLLLIFIEFFLPGAIFAVAGSILILTALFLYATSGTSFLAFVGVCLLVCFLLAGTIKLALLTIRRTRCSQSFFSDDDQAGFVASSFDKKAVGKRGLVLTDLKPAGYVLIDDKKLQARSESGYLVAGSDIEVTGGDEDTLIVKLIERGAHDG